MCTINMTFEVPESKAIDIEALKQNMKAYFNLVISFPSVLKAEDSSVDTQTDNMLNRFAGCWHGSESHDEIMDTIRENRSIRKPLNM